MRGFNRCLKVSYLTALAFVIGALAAPRASQAQRAPLAPGLMMSTANMQPSVQMAQRMLMMAGSTSMVQMGGMGMMGMGGGMMGMGGQMGMGGGMWGMGGGMMGMSGGMMGMSGGMMGMGGMSMMGMGGMGMGGMSMMGMSGFGGKGMMGGFHGAKGI